MTLNLVVLVSGRGSNLQAILDAIASGSLDASVRLVLSDVQGAPALERAARAGVKTACVLRSDFTSRREWESAIASLVEEAEPDLVVLAGFMKVLSASFVQRFPGKIINIHPSLLPAFPGLDAQKQALDRGVRYTGCTVHYVDAGVDSGPIIDQRVVEVLPGDDVDALAERILLQEHEVLVDVIRRIGGKSDSDLG